MAARSSRVIFHNDTSLTLTRVFSQLDHGQWTDPWYPPETIQPNSTREWRSESSGILTGTEGSVRYSVADNTDSSVYVQWDNPYAGRNKYHQFTDDAYEVFHTGGDGNDATVEFRFRFSRYWEAQGFLPSIHGFKFSNNYGDIPYSLPPLKDSILDLKYGNAKNGLCGGMVYAARNYFESGRVIPAAVNPPLGESDLLFLYIVECQFDAISLDDVTLALKLMDPLYPDTDETLIADGRAYTMANVEYPLVRQDILAGIPSPIWLVTVKSLSPFDIGSCHQVLAYGYQAHGQNVVLHVYDPNQPETDTTTMSFNISSTSLRIDVNHNIDIKDHVTQQQLPIYCFFRQNWSYRKPTDLSSNFSLRLYARTRSLDLSRGIRGNLFGALSTPVTHLRDLT